MHIEGWNIFLSEVSAKCRNLQYSANQAVNNSTAKLNIHSLPNVLFLKSEES